MEPEAVGRMTRGGSWVSAWASSAPIEVQVAVAYLAVASKPQMPGSC